MPAYNDAIEGLQSLAEVALSQDDSLVSVITALSAIALAKGQRNLADAIQNFDSEDENEAFLKNYWWRGN